MKFEKRLEAPKKTNKYYGKPDPFISSGYGMFQCGGNCTDYAYCRFREAQKNMNASDKLPTSNAGTWYKKVKASGTYKTGQVAKLGAIAVWDNGKAGHVNIVEEIYADGTWMSSNSGYKSSLFYTRKITDGGKFYKKGYKLLGFIYPDVEFDEDIWYPGTYITLKSKYIRTSPEVKTDNYVYVKNCMASVKPKLTSKKPNDKAKFKVGVEVELTKFESDKKGNLWGRMKNSYICVNDSSGKQVKKVD